MLLKKPVKQKVYLLDEQINPLKKTSEINLNDSNNLSSLAHPLLVGQR